MDIEPQAKGLGMGGHYAHDLWLNLPSLPFLDSCDSKSPFELTEMLLPSLFRNKESYKSTLLSSPGSLLGLLSVSRNCVDSPFPQTYTCDGHLEDRRTVSETCQSPAPELPSSPRTDVHGLSAPYCQEVLSSPDDGTHLTRPTTGPPEIQRSGTDGHSHHLLWPWSWPAGSSSPRETARARAEHCGCRQAALEARVSRVTRRLHVLLGEHTLRHCAGQLEGLRGRLEDRQERLCGPPPLTRGPNRLTGDAPFIATATQEGSRAFGGGHRHSPVRGSPWHSQLSGDMQKLARCGQAVLRSVQEVLDSDATESSSDEEWEPEDRSGSRTSSGCLSCEWSWQCERAKLASCWTWLQLRLSELDLQIQQIGELRQHILASKASVVLAESQPLTDRQIQQALLSETAGLTFTAGGMHAWSPEPDTEPSSPTRLLRTIERQSAQLNLLVNTLMAPLSTSPSSSPVSKGTCTLWTGQQKRPFNSPLTDVFLHTTSTCLAGQKRRRLCGRRQHPLQVDATCVSARSRPLLTYHKPRLFIMSQSSLGRQVLESPACPCVGCVSCDPVRVCSRPACSSSNESSHSTAHLVPPLSSESSPPLSVPMALFREDWLRWPETNPPELGFTSHGYKPSEEASSSLFNCTHQMHAGSHVSHRRLGTPAHWGRAHRGPSRPLHRRTLKRRHHRQADNDMGLSQPGKLLLHTEDSAEDMGPPHSTHALQRGSQFPVRRKNGENVYNIDNIIIPASLTACSKVDKLQYKDILTPSWRLVDIVPLVQKEEEEEEDLEKVEVLSDEVFSHRHQGCEGRERLHWDYWGKGRRYSRSSRCVCVCVCVCIKHGL
uniref:PEHE domain-containing protein n=1 Tax=Electrophorus electricus TaxID=8005 RepID=A0A4W4GJN5_ELEEL